MKEVMPKIFNDMELTCYSNLIQNFLAKYDQFFKLIKPPAHQIWYKKNYRFETTNKCSRRLSWYHFERTTLKHVGINRLNIYADYQGAYFEIENDLTQEVETYEILNRPNTRLADPKYTQQRKEFPKLRHEQYHFLRFWYRC